MITFRTMLGLAASEGSIAVAEVAMVSGRPSLLRAARFAAEAQGEPKQPGTAQAFRHFLRQHHFSASRCVIGLEAGWLIAKEKVLPPGSSASVAGALSIAAERDFNSSATEFVFDCTAPADSPGGTSSLLVAASRRKLEDVSAMAKAAGLSVAGVTSSTLALAAATEASAFERLVLYLCPGRAELVLQTGGGFRVLRRLSAPAQPERLASEICRVASFLPAAADADARQEPNRDRELLIWDDGLGLDAAAVDLLRDRLAIPVRVCRFPDDLGVGASDGAADGAGAVQAAALAAGAAARRPAIVDFLHSRLATRRKARLGRYAVWGIAAAVAVCAAAAYFVWDWRTSRQELAALQSQMDGLKGKARDASDVLDNLSFAREWYDSRPRYLECLRELTLVFPEQTQAWATGIAVRDKVKADKNPTADSKPPTPGKSAGGSAAVSTADLKPPTPRTLLLELSGKSASESAALEIIDRLRACPRFSNVKSLYIRQGGSETREVSFAITFEFTGAQ